MRFRDVVSRELERRQQQNGRYSLRRFAARLGVHHATLSRLLRGTRPVTARTVRAIARRMAIAATEIETLVATENEAMVLLAIRRDAFRPDSRWLATVAGMPVDHVNIALQALLRKGRLLMTSRNQWTVSGGSAE